jgi:hypothetical protein
MSNWRAGPKGLAPIDGAGAGWLICWFAELGAGVLAVGLADWSEAAWPEEVPATAMVLKSKMLPEKRSSRDTIVFAADARFVAMAESPIFESRRAGLITRLRDYSYQLPRVNLTFERFRNPVFRSTAPQTRICSPGPFHGKLTENETSQTIKSLSSSPPTDCNGRSGLGDSCPHTRSTPFIVS